MEDDSSESVSLGPNPSPAALTNPILQELCPPLVSKLSPILTCPHGVVVTVMVEKAVAAFAWKRRIRKLRAGVLI